MAPPKKAAPKSAPARRNPPAKPAPADDARTIAHHLDSAAFNLGHTTRHIEEARKTPKMSAVNFNLDHASKHAKETQATVAKLADSVTNKLPAVAGELRKLQAAKPVQATAGKANAKAPAKAPAKKAR